MPNWHDSTMLARARELRKNATDSERRLWRYLRGRQVLGHKFRRQHPVGPYIVDFVCLEKRLVVELDGGQHMEADSRDARRTGWLESQGFRVIRFWNNAVFREREAVLISIAEALNAGDEPGCEPGDDH